MPNKFTYLNQINLSVYTVYTCIQYTLYTRVFKSGVYGDAVLPTHQQCCARTEGRSDCSDRMGKRHKFSVFLVLCFTRCFVAGSRFKMADLDKGRD